MVDVTELSSAEARQRFAELVNRVSVRKKWLRLTRRGKPVAGLVPLEDFEYFEGPEDSDSPQGMATFDDIMTREERVRAEMIGEAPVAYQVDNVLHRVSSARARNNMSEILNRVCYGKERIILTRHDWDLLAIVPPEVFEKYLEIDELEDEIDGKRAEEALHEVETEGTVPLEEILERYGID